MSRDGQVEFRVAVRAAYDVAPAIQDDRPRYGAHETRNPANQWLANLRARTRQVAEIAAAGEQAREYVHRELYARLPWLRYGRDVRTLP
jgi:hypothetical protein